MATAAGNRAATAQQHQLISAGCACQRKLVPPWAMLGGYRIDSRPRNPWITTLRNCRHRRQAGRIYRMARPGDSTRRGQLSGRVISPRKPRDGHATLRIRSGGTKLFVGSATGSSNTTRPLARLRLCRTMPIGRFPPAMFEIVEINLRALRSTLTTVDLIPAQGAVPTGGRPLGCHEGRPSGDDGSDLEVWRRKNRLTKCCRRNAPTLIAQAWLGILSLIIRPMIGVRMILHREAFCRH